MAERPVLCIALVLALAMAAGPVVAANPQKSEGELAAARSTLAKGDLNGAIAQFKQAVLDNPENAAARFELGRVMIRFADYASADKELRAAKERAYPEAQLAPEFARLYLAQHKYAELIAEIQPGERPPEEESTVRLARGIAFTNLKKFAQAEASINEAIERTTKPSRALIALARLRETVGDYDGAVVNVERAIEADPKNVQAWFTNGEIHLDHGDQAGAFAAFDKAIELQPNYEEARMARAQLHLQRHEVAAARMDVDVLLKQDSSRTFIIYLNAELLAAEKNFPAAEAALEKLGFAINDSPRTLYLLANIKVGENQFEQAEAHINRYLSLRPNEPSGTMILADLLTRRGNVQRAVEILETAVDKNQDNTELLAKLSAAYVLAKRPDDAAAALDKAARLYGAKKDETRALDAAEKAYGIAETPRSSDMLGWMLVQKGDAARALPILQKAAIDASDKPAIRYHYAVALLKAGRHDDAKRQLQIVVQANPPIAELGDAQAMLKDLGG